MQPSVMEQVQEYLAMGGYGLFIWPAYALTAVVLVGMLITTLRRLRALQSELARLHVSEAPTAGAPLHEARP